MEIITSMLRTPVVIQWFVSFIQLTLQSFFLFLSLSLYLFLSLPCFRSRHFHLSHATRPYHTTITSRLPPSSALITLEYIRLLLYHSHRSVNNIQGYLNATRVIKREAIYALVAALYSGVNLFVTWYSWINNYADLCDALHSMPREGHDNDAISSTPIRERGFFPSFWVKDRVCTWPLEDPRLTAVLADDFQVLNSTSSQLGLLSLYNAEQYDVARMVGVILELEAVPMLLLASMVYTKCLHIDFAEDLQDFNFTASETFSLGLFGLRFILSFALCKLC